MFYYVEAVSYTHLSYLARKTLDKVYRKLGFVKR